jgi:hypothetical protein
MTSKLPTNINAKRDLRFWHAKLAGYYSKAGYLEFKLETGATVRPHIELGKLYFMGTGGDFNYENAMYHIEQALIAKRWPPFFSSNSYTWHNQTQQDFYKSCMYENESQLQDAINSWKGETINRIEMLKNACFDSLLNCLRADVLHSIDRESQTLTELFDTLWQASFDFVTKKDPNLVTAKQTFATTAIDAIRDTRKTLVTDNFTTLLTKILGAIVSICTLGIANYATNRSMFGLFSSRIDISIKLGNLLAQLGHHEDNTTNENGHHKHHYA